MLNLFAAGSTTAHGALVIVMDGETYPPADQKHHQQIGAPTQR
jgi:hypothetical protein